MWRFDPSLGCRSCLLGRAEFCGVVVRHSAKVRHRAVETRGAVEQCRWCSTVAQSSSLWNVQTFKKSSRGNPLGARGVFTLPSTSGYFHRKVRISIIHPREILLFLYLWDWGFYIGARQRPSRPQDYILGTFISFSTLNYQLSPKHYILIRPQYDYMSGLSQSYWKGVRSVHSRLTFFRYPWFPSFTSVIIHTHTSSTHNIMLLYRVTFKLTFAFLVAAEIIPRMPTVIAGCPEGYRLTTKICADEDQPPVCCPFKGEQSCFNDYERCIPHLVGCPKATFACPAEYYGNCCPDEGFCGTYESDPVCYT